MGLTVGRKSFGGVTQVINRHVTAIALGLASLCPIIANGQSGAAAGSCVAQSEYVVLLHGGTSAYSPDQFGDAHLDIMRSVVASAREQLATGDTALNVVVDAIVKLENSGLMDAGKGSIFNTDGYTEMDASLMEGHTGELGAVAAMQRLKNPILGAKIVLERTPHVFFVGTTGEETLIELGAETVEDPASYFVPYRNDDATAAKESGTVGAVALDRCGNLAAGTSTGGFPGKLPGRVGDSPIMGASTFANEEYALSATGRGENFIKRYATLNIVTRATLQNVPLQDAADYVVHTLLGEIDGVDAGIIAISRNGDIVLSTANNFGELHGYASDSIDVTVGVAVP